MPYIWHRHFQISDRLFWINLFQLAKTCYGLYMSHPMIKQRLGVLDRGGMFVIDIIDSWMDTVRMSIMQYSQSKEDISVDIFIFSRWISKCNLFFNDHPIHNCSRSKNQFFDRNPYRSFYTIKSSEMNIRVHCIWQVK